MAELTGVLTNIIFLTQRLLEAIKNNNDAIVKQHVKDLAALNSGLYLEGRKLKHEDITNTSRIVTANLNEIIKQKDRQKQRTATENIARATRMLFLKLRGSKTPAEDWLIYSIMTAIAAYSLKIKETSTRVAAILVSPKGEFLLTGNDESTVIFESKHAEVNAVVRAIEENFPLKDATLFISAIPCHNLWEVQLSETPSEITAKITKANTTEWAGKSIMWKRTKNPNIYLSEHSFVTEVFTGAYESVVYYIYSDKWIPREIRKYAKDKKSAVIEQGCAVTIALSKIKEIFYTYEDVPSECEKSIKPFSQGILLMKKYGVKTNLVENELINQISANAKSGNIKKMHTLVAKINQQLHINVPELLETRFGFIMP